MKKLKLREIDLGHTSSMFQSCDSNWVSLISKGHNSCLCTRSFHLLVFQSLRPVWLPEFQLERHSVRLWSHTQVNPWNVTLKARWRSFASVTTLNSLILEAKEAAGQSSPVDLGLSLSRVMEDPYSIGTNGPSDLWLCLIETWSPVSVWEALEHIPEQNFACCLEWVASSYDASNKIPFHISHVPQKKEAMTLSTSQFYR